MKRGRKPLPQGDRKDVMLRLTVTEGVDEWIKAFTKHNHITTTTLLRECLGEFLFDFAEGRRIVLTDPTFEDVKSLILKRREGTDGYMS